MRRRPDLDQRGGAEAGGASSLAGFGTKLAAVEVEGRAEVEACVRRQEAEDEDGDDTAI